jgi:hypothetical protein
VNVVVDCSLKVDITAYYFDGRPSLWGGIEIEGGVLRSSVLFVKWLWRVGNIFSYGGSLSIRRVAAGLI